MKIPQTFVTEKNLESNIKRLLKKYEASFEADKKLLSDLEIESEAPPLNCSYDKSLERLRNKGFERHLRPWELFDLIISHLEERLIPDLDYVVDDMLKQQSPQWISMAVERKGNELICYIDPEDIRLGKDDAIKYLYFYTSVGKLKFSEVRKFDITGIPSGKWVDINQFDGELIKYLYTRRFEDLPEKMREGSCKAQIHLPYEDEGLQPINYGGVAFLSSSAFSYSRGVRRKFH